MRTIRITEAHDYDLVGELIDAPERRQRQQSQPHNPFVVLRSTSIPKSHPAARISSDSRA